MMEIPSTTKMNDYIFVDVNNSINKFKHTQVSDAGEDFLRNIIVYSPNSSDLISTVPARYVLPQNTSTTKIQSSMKINSLIKRRLKKEINITVESDEDGFIAKATDLPLFGYGDYPNEAIENLKYEIESCYKEVLQNNNFSKEWLKYKKYLTEIVE